MATHHKINAVFEIVTPMFAGGFDAGSSGAEPRLTAAAVVGALRFWWRALAWARLPEGSETERLACLHAWESALFGAAAGEKQGGQGAFLLRLLAADGEGRLGLTATELRRGDEARWPLGGYPRIVTGNHRHWSRSGSGLAYLAGLGLVRQVAVRPSDGGRDFRLFADARRAVEPGQEFVARFVSRASIAEPVIPSGRPLSDNPPSLWEAVQAFGLLGGLGSRSRRGFGSVALRKVEALEGTAPAWEAPATQKAYGDRVQALVRAEPHRVAALPTYSAFSERSLVGFRADQVRHPNEREHAVRTLHNRIGHEFQQFRGWGFHHQVGGEAAKQHFPDDHGWFKAIETAGARQPAGRVPAALPRRAVFGLPHNYQTRSGVIAEVSPNPRDNSKNYDRRASPFLIHLHAFERGPVATYLLLEATFLSDTVANGLAVRASQRGRGGSRSWNIPGWRPDYRVIQSFMAKKPPP